jgi:hypothetical protein
LRQQTFERKKHLFLFFHINNLNLFGFKILKMRKLLISFLTIGLFFSFNSCIKHEIIPAPSTTVDLNCNFVGYVNGTQTELTQNVIGYNAVPVNDRYVYAGAVLSRMIYTSEIKSLNQSQSFKITLGSHLWDATVATEPTLTMFNDFHSSNSGIALPFKDYATMVNANPSVVGVQIEYKDNNGVIWKSKETDPGQIANFTILNQASDNTGDYSIFECSFSCLVWTYDVQLGQDISIPITSAKFRGWFKR